MDGRRPSWRRPFLVGGAAVALAVLAIVTLTGADPLAWGPRGERVNAFRADHGRAGLEQRARLQDAARSYSRTLAGTRVLRHADCWAAGACSGGEAIGFGPDYATIFRAWTRSSCHDATYVGPCPGHRELLLDRDFTRMGIGCTRDPLGTLWCVLRVR